MSGVCEAIRRVSEDLYVVLQEGHAQPWVVMEMCRDGESRLVSRYAELDHRIIHDLQKMLATPFQERIDALQKRLDYENDHARQARETEEWERFIWGFNRELSVCGFVDQKYLSSYRPVAKKRGGN